MKKMNVFLHPVLPIAGKTLSHLRAPLVHLGALPLRTGEDEDYCKTFVE